MKKGSESQETMPATQDGGNETQAQPTSSRLELESPQRLTAQSDNPLEDRSTRPDTFRHLVEELREALQEESRDKEDSTGEPATDPVSEPDMSSADEKEGSDVVEDQTLDEAVGLSEEKIKELLANYSGTETVLKYDQRLVDSGDGKLQIRLLILLPGEHEDPIRCELEVVDIDERPEYEALSYCWGIAEPKYPINVSEAKFEATMNLKLGLYRLRRPDSARRLWIDAVCINQSDDQEKSYQVGKMRDIYTHARSTIVWLGEEENESHLAIQMCNRMYETFGITLILQSLGGEDAEASALLKELQLRTTGGIDVIQAIQEYFYDVGMRVAQGETYDGPYKEMVAEQVAEAMAETDDESQAAESIEDTSLPIVDDQDDANSDHKSEQIQSHTEAGTSTVSSGDPKVDSETEEDKAQSEEDEDSDKDDDDDDEEEEDSDKDESDDEDEDEGEGEDEDEDDNDDEDDEDDEDESSDEEEGEETDTDAALEGNQEEPSSREIVALHALLDRPWFRRVWIIQEATVSDDVTVQCGSQSISWWNFLFGYAITTRVRRISGRGPSYRRNLDLMSNTRLSLRAALTERATDPQLQLLSLLYRYRRYLATDPRDKIFALLGLTNTELSTLGSVPDYSKDVREIYLMIATALIQNTTSLEMLSIPHGESSVAQGLPSWVPNWADSGPKPHLLAGDRNHPELVPASPDLRVFQASLDAEATPKVADDGGLVLQGYVIDEIVEVTQMLDADEDTLGQVPSWGVSDNLAILVGSFGRFFGFLAKFIDVVEEWKTLGKASDQDRLETFARTLWTDLNSDSAIAECREWLTHLDTLKDFVKLLPPFDTELTEENAEAFMLSLMPALSSIDPEKFQFQQNLPCIHIVNRRLARTSKDRLCLVPSETTVKDRLCLLSGSRTPHVIRDQDGAFVHVGEAFVDGVMYGEAWNQEDCHEICLS